MLDLSVVIPVYNERESLPHLISELHAALASTGLRYELILVDDGSKDESYAWLEHAAAQDQALTVIRFRRNFGQTAALQAGLDAARGDKVVTMDADLQNDPADIPRMLEKLNQGHDLIAGWRADRQDAFLNRRLPSIIANRIISMTTKVKLHDYGCTLKAMTREVAKELRLYGEMHRFIPVVASFVGVSILEMRVNHRARQFGTTKYGIGRTLRVVLDLMTVRFLQSYLTRPMQVFGLAGLVCFALGVLLSVKLAFEKIFMGQALAGRPLLLLGVLLIVVGIQLVSLGLVADLVSRTYHESQGKRPYYVRTRLTGAGVKGFAPAKTEQLAPLGSWVREANDVGDTAPALGDPPSSRPPPDRPAPGTITAPPGASFPPPTVVLSVPDDFAGQLSRRTESVRGVTAPIEALRPPPPVEPELSVLPPLAAPPAPAKASAPAGPPRPNGQPRAEVLPTPTAPAVLPKPAAPPSAPLAVAAGAPPVAPLGAPVVVARELAPAAPVRTSTSTPPPPPARGVVVRSAPPPPPRRGGE